MNPEFERLEYGENEDTGLRDPWWKEIWPQDAAGEAQVLSQTSATYGTDGFGNQYVPTNTGIQWPDTSGYVSTWVSCNCNHQTKDAFNVAKLLMEKGLVEVRTAKQFIDLVDGLKKVL